MIRRMTLTIRSGWEGEPARFMTGCKTCGEGRANFGKLPKGGTALEAKSPLLYYRQAQICLEDSFKKSREPRWGMGDQENSLSQAGPDYPLKALDDLSE